MLTEKQKVNAAIKGIVRKGSKIVVRKWNINPSMIQPKLTKSQRQQLLKKKQKLASAVIMFTNRID